MRMADDGGLAPVLARVVREDSITHVVETGTYLGAGSTKMLAEAFPRDRPPESFVTIEANWSSWRTAKENLAHFPFVTPLWGRTVTRHAALAFVRSDEALRHHERWPDVFIDDTRHPVKSYTRELKGRLGGRPRGLRDAAAFVRDRLRSYAGDDLLPRYLSAARDRKPLILLDSAGGIGLLELQTVLVLDDTHHVKHFRSIARVRSDPSFFIVAESAEHGWAVARHAPAGT
jgi:hypothetical protein